jgi:hypothetical protein
VQEVLKPYYTCLFAQSWKDNFPKHAKLMAGLRRSMLEWVQSLRSKDLEARQESEIYIRKRDGRWFIFEPLLSYDEDYYQRPRFTGSVLESFQRFLKQNGEGALFVLLLLMTVGHPGEVQSDSIFYKHPKPEPEEWRPRPIYDLVYAERNFPLPKIWGDSRENGLYERYPGFNMSYFPVLDDRDPLDVLLSLERVAEIISDLNTVDFTKYYWRCDGGDPYKAYRETYHYSEVLVVPKTRKGIFTKELEKREDLQLLWRKFIQKRRWHWQEIMVGKPHWPVGYEKLIKMYLDCRACDIARYGQKVANLTFPQPTIEGATSKQVADLVASLVTLLQEHTLQKEKQEDEEMIANLKEKAQRIFDEKFSNKMIPMPDIHRLALTYNEIEALKAACLKELRQGEK